MQVLAWNEMVPAGFMAFLLAVAAMGGAAWAIRGRIIGRELRCKSCGYALNGIHRTPQSLCPECGSRVWLGADFRLLRLPRLALLRVSCGCWALSVVMTVLLAAGPADAIDHHRLLSNATLIEIASRTTVAQPQERAWHELARREKAGGLSRFEAQEVQALALNHSRHVGRLSDVRPEYLQAWIADG